MIRQTQLIPMSKARSSAESAGALLNQPVSLHFASVFKFGDDRDGGHVDQIWVQQISLPQRVSSLKDKIAP